MIALYELPAELRCRVNVVDPDAMRKTRLGRVTFRHDGALGAQVLARGGDVIRTGTITSVDRIGADAWTLDMADGTRWVVLGSGCGCGG